MLTVPEPVPETEYGPEAAAARGWHVFPLARNSKIPHKDTSWPVDATTDVASLPWQSGENYGIAAKKSGLVIIDCDMPKPGFRWPADWVNEPGVMAGTDVLATLAERAGILEWPYTFTVETPTGGWHLYFRAPAGRKIGNRPLGPLVDVRGGGDTNGGYVVGPGSVIDGKRYTIIDARPAEPLPAWITDILDPPRRQYQMTSRKLTGTAYGLAALRDETAKVAKSTVGTRNHQLNRSAFQLGQLVASGVLDADEVIDALIEAARFAGLQDHEIARTVASGLRAARPREGLSR